MSKHGFVDLNITTSEKTPDSNFVRIRSTRDGVLQYIFPNGDIKHISSPWELQIIDNSVTDPSTISTLNQWDRYIVPVLAINDWNGHDNDVATWNGISWDFDTPEQGWCLYVRSENSIYSFDGTQWKTLTALPVIFDVTYDELYQSYLNSSLIPGAFYKIIDYQSANRTSYRRDDVYTDPNPIQLLIKAVKNNELEYTAHEIGEPYHDIKYDVNFTEPSYFWTLKNVSDGSEIDGEFYAFDDRTVIKDNYDNYFKVEFLSDKQVYFGTETIVDYNPNHLTNFVIYDNNTWNPINVNLTDPDVSWDNSTKILTLSASSNYTFYSSSSENSYYISVSNIRVASPEKRKGRITYRKDIYNNIEGDIDWKYYKYKCYHSQTHEFEPNDSSMVDGYYSCTDFSIRIQNPSIFSRTEVLSIDTNDYVLKSVFEGNFSKRKNIKFSNSYYIVIEGGYLDHVNFVDCKQVYFGDSSIIYSNFTSYSTSFYTSAVSGTFLNNTNIVSSGSVYFGSISNSIISNTHPSCIGNISNCKYIDLRGIRMNNQAIIQTSSGSISTTHMLGTAPSQVIITNSNFKHFSRCYFGDNTNIDLFKTSEMMQSSHFNNVNIYNVELKFSIYTDRVNFENIIIENSKFSGEIPGSNINFVELRNSEIKGIIYDDVDKIVNYNFIDVDNTYTLPNISVGVYIDSTASYDIELPPQPFENQEFIFIDKTGNCHINPINIVVSSSPGSGIINTINGNNNRIIDKQYGILKIRYNATGGWVVIQETVVNNPIFPDDITIEQISNALGIKNIDYIIDDDGESIDGSNTAMSDPHRELPTRAFLENYISSNSISGDNFTIEDENNFKTISTSQNINTELFDNWDNSAYTADWSTSGQYDSINSSFHLAPGADAILSYDGTATTALFTNGDYQLYSTIDLTSYDIYVYDDNTGSTVSASSIVKENNLYLITFSLIGGESIIEIGFNNNLDTPCTIWFINKNATLNSNDITTIKNISQIIDSNDLSIDGNIIFKDDSHEELVTRDYVDKKISNTDDITLEKEKSISQVSTQSDINLLLYEAWSNEISNNNWTIGSHCSYSNGILSVNIPSSMPFEDILVTSTPTIFSKGYNFRFISDIQLPIGTISILTSSDLQSWQYNEKLLANGYYEYSLYAPNQVEFIGLHFNQGMSVINCNLQFYLMDQYPEPDKFKIKNIDYIIDDDNQSIDGSDTPMSDPHKELVTRAFVNNVFPTKAINAFTVDSSIITNGYVDTSNNINLNQHNFVILNGIILEEGSSFDYYITNGNRINFTSNITLTSGDRIVIKYFN